MYILIDPPSPFSPVDQLQSWVEELERMAEEHRGDEEAMLTIGPGLDQARRWLERQRAANA